jgi:hypothetical protein
MERKLICSGCGNEIERDDDLIAPRNGSVYALKSVVLQHYEDGEVVWVPGWVCDECGRKRATELLH